ncbi:hypothetical protein [Actinomadura rudentiformis]|uniref:DUF4352 domain-containing protein n=1 Tax=Actinomadura rudentiformis TaxID=359158 RepID=A0A6H9YA77_9ACTN|nr:hypothetical protein [Actinomadura rudentiformis]KAB2340587.1 hypothetical protein F8566_44495 [Actinomadura rudentiformis]
MRRMVAASLTIGLLTVGACAEEKGPERPSAGVTATKAPDGGQLRLVDRGLSVFPGPGNGARFRPEAKAAGRDYNVVSWGILIENTSKWAATLTLVDVHLVDAAGVALSKTDYDRPKAETIAVIRPGERFGMGLTQNLAKPGKPRKRLRTPADLQVQIGQSAWFPPNSRSNEFVKITASEIKTPHDGRATVSFTMESPSHQQAWATALFRNAAGKIIGGTGHCEDSFGDQPERVVAPGRSRGTINTRYVVPHVAAARTEVYLDTVPVNDLGKMAERGQCGT